MIDKENNYVEWALLMYQLEDAYEHLGDLIKEMTKDKKPSEDDFCEIDFSVHLAHIYAHLNIAWNTRNLTKAYEMKDREKLIQFPTDIEPF